MNTQTENQETDRLPEAMVRRLKEADRRVSVLTPRADRAIGRLAQAHFAARAPVAVPNRRWAVPAAAVAASAIVALLVVNPLEDRAPFGPVLINDIDGSGRVDILDAFALARQRAGGERDVGDGEVARLAAYVVSLNPAGGAL